MSKSKEHSWYRPVGSSTGFVAAKAADTWSNISREIERRVRMLGPWEVVKEINKRRRGNG